MKRPSLLDDTSYALCGICRGEHDTSYGVCPPGKSKILWCCSECLPIGGYVYEVVDMRGSSYAREARDRAGMAGGAFLEKLGKFSLADLSETEWRDFLDVLFRAREDHLRRMFATHVPTAA